MADKNISIIDEINAFAYSTFGNDFVFRPGQREVCEKIINHFLSDAEKPRYVLEAPTGSGKSIIAMIVAGVLSEFHEKRGSILVSDLSLLDQYITDFKKYKPEWAYIKGKSNYMCLVNGHDYVAGNCNILEGFACPLDMVCPYRYAVHKMVESKVCVSTYQYWLIHNYINSAKNMVSDDDFLICDEAHNLMSIVQQMFSLSVGEVYIKHANEICNICEDFTELKFVEGITELISDIISSAEKSENDKIIVHISALLSLLKNVWVKYKYYSEHQDKAEEDGIFLDTKYYRELRWLMSVKEKLTLYTESTKGRAENVIATLSDSRKNAILNSTDESYLIDKYFHNGYKCGLFMSATIGDIEEFCVDINLKENTISERMNSTFNFDNSCIFYNPSYSLSRTTYDTSLPICVNMMDRIMEIYKDYRGCIFVSSYDMCMEMYEKMNEESRSRIIIYKDSANKASALMQLKSSKNAVLMGPSIFEGISLDNDLCRFSIIAKVPYADTRNKLVKYKMDQFGFNRYSMSAIQNIIQAVGRGVRNENDWCTTFITDGAFSNLLKRNRKSFGESFCSRLHVFGLSDLYGK